VSAISFIPPKW